MQRQEVKPREEGQPTGNRTRRMHSGSEKLSEGREGNSTGKRTMRKHVGNSQQSVPPPLKTKHAARKGLSRGKKGNPQARGAKPREEGQPAGRSTVRKYAKEVCRGADDVEARCK